MKDFPYWRGAIYNAKSPQVLKAVGEDLSQFQKQSDFLGGDPKLTDDQLTALRKMYADKLKKFVAETIDVQDPKKPEFKK